MSVPLFVRVERHLLGGWDTIPPSYTRYKDYTVAYWSWQRAGLTVVQVDDAGRIMRVLPPCIAIVDGCSACALLAGQHPAVNCPWECVSKEVHSTFHIPKES